YRIVQQNLVRQQLRNSARQLRLRPVRDAATKAQPPEQPGPARLDGQEEILDAPKTQLRRCLGERLHRPLDALVVDGAGGYRLHRVRAHRVESEPDPARGLDGLELAANPVAPGVVHAEHLSACRQLDPGSAPGLRDDLALELQLVVVGGVLPLTTAAA